MFHLQSCRCQLSLSKYHDTAGWKLHVFFPLLQAMTLTALRFRSRPRRSHQTGCAAALLVGYQAVKDLVKLNLRLSLTTGSFPQLHPTCNSHKIASLLTATWPRKGSGAKCKKCPENSFTANYDSEECEQCPQGSKAPAGSTSHSSCICDVGVLDNPTGQWTLCSTWQFVRCNSMFPNLFSTPLAMPKSARSTVS